MESRSKSLPQLDNSNMEEDEYSNQTGSLPFTPGVPMKKVTCHTYSLLTPRGAPKSEQPGGDLDVLKSNPLYHSAELPGGAPAQQGEDTYAEVPGMSTPAVPPDDTYEQLPEESGSSNTYESLEDMKTKKPKHTWGKNVSEEEITLIRLVLDLETSRTLTSELVCQL